MSNVGECRLTVVAEVDEFCAAMKRATEAAKEFNSALRSIPVVFRIYWYVLDWMRLLKSNDYSVLPKRKSRFDRN